MPVSQDGLPGDPGTWRGYRAALKKLIARAELSALAIERMSNDPAARTLGAVSIADATVGRKLADREEPVDARSVRTIVVCCALAATRRGETLPDADVQRWLMVRSALAERPTDCAAEPSSAVAPSPGERVPGDPQVAGERSRRGLPGREARRAWLALALVAVLAVAGTTLWAVTHAGRSRADRGPAAAPLADGSAAGADGSATGADGSAAGTDGSGDLVSGRPACLNPPDKPAGAGLTMVAPGPGTLLTGDSTEATGKVSLAPDERPPWLLLYAIGQCRFYLEAPTLVSRDTWSGTLYYDPAQRGAFVAYAMVVKAADDQRLHEIVEASRSPYIVRLPAGARIVHVTVHCCH